MKPRQYEQPRRKRRHRTRRRRNGFAALLPVILAVMAFAASLFFRVSFIEVTGAATCDPQAIKLASGVETGDFLFYVNKSAAIRAIIADQPYVDTVKIKSHVPNVIEIVIAERQPIAVIKHFNEFWLIDERGKLLESTRDKPELPEITGLTALVPTVGTTLEIKSEESGKLSPLLEIMVMLREREMTVGEISYDSVMGISFTYLDRFNILLGMPVALEDKLDFIPEALAQLEPNATGTINLIEVENKENKKGRFIPD